MLKVTIHPPRQIIRCVLCIGWAAIACAQDWGITITQGEKISVSLENDKMRAVYKEVPLNCPPCEYGIGELYAEGKAGNLAGKSFDLCASRRKILSANIISKDQDKQIVEIKWNGTSGGTTVHTTSRVTLYRGCPVILIDQKSGNSPNIVDASNGSVVDSWAIYNADKFAHLKLHTEGCIYSRDSDGCLNGRPPDGSPGERAYNGWFILGAYRASDGYGWGRLMNGDVDIIKLLNWGGYGLEFFWGAQKSFLFVVPSGGKEEIFNVGKQIADWANAGEKGLPLSTTAISGYGMERNPQRNSYSNALRNMAPGSELRIYALDGRLAGSHRAVQERVGTSRLPSGIYLIRIRNAESAKGRQFRAFLQ